MVNFTTSIIYNRGVDKREIISDRYDLDRFFKSIVEFNRIETIGSIYEHRFSELGNPVSKLVNIVAYCINPNHYHFILEQVADKGIEKFMHRLGLGYAKYFNNKYKRVGTLYQGRFKSIHIDSNEYLLHLSAYINLNAQIHDYDKNTFIQSSFNEYISRSEGICTTTIILDQFTTIQKYIDFSMSSAQETFNRREKERFENE